MRVGNYINCKKSCGRETNMKRESEYIERIMERANIQKMVGYLLYGAEIDQADDCYEERITEANRKLDEITKGDEKLQASINEVIANFTELYAELGFKAGIIFATDVFRKG